MVDKDEEKKERGKSIRKTVTRLAFELLTVIAGILIALFVNNIQEQRNDERILNETLRSLSLEFDKNLDNIKAIAHRLNRFRDTLTFYENNESISIFDLTVKAPGLSAADLYTTNWQVTLSSNSLRLINFETVTLLSKIDAKHNELKDQAAVLNDLVYNTAIYKTDREGFYHRRVLASWISGYMANEGELAALYDQFRAVVTKNGN
jgi:hypothetical protein